MVAPCISGIEPPPRPVQHLHDIFSAVGTIERTTAVFAFSTDEYPGPNGLAATRVICDDLEGVVTGECDDMRMT